MRCHTINQCVICVRSKGCAAVLAADLIRNGAWVGIRRAADTVCDELDELAMVITGSRDALLDPLHKTP